MPVRTEKLCSGNCLLKAFCETGTCYRFREEAGIYFVCSAYELKDKNSITLLRDYLEQ